MTLIDDIKRDREAGTPGPWATDWTGYDFWCGPCTVLGGSRQSETDARRIARVPDMEAALLAADELAAAIMHEREMVCQDMELQAKVAKRLEIALSAYRAAVSGAAE